MTFSVGDYEHSIARIFDENNNVIGTGFLVAPGYALTCAHVVLQALGIHEDDFGTSDAPLGRLITLDFPVANGDRIKAKIVAWRPYRIDSGDIAGLKLESSAPQKSKPLPTIRCSREEIQDQRHAVYGFANDNGDRTDAYKPKSNAPGGRFQLYKAGDNPPDETIQAGFSGAPVWNYERKSVIGMVATAALPKDQISKAYAISEEQLSPVIQELFARSLYDCLCSGLETSRQKVQNAAEAAFWLCDTDGDRKSSDDLLDRLLYLGELPSRGWQDAGREVDRLSQFALFLMVLDGLPEAILKAIEVWVKARSFNFSSLYVKANRYRQERRVAAADAPAHLIVQIKPDEQNTENVYVSMWVIGDRDGYDPLEPPQPRVRDHVIAFTALPIFLETWLQEESDLDAPMIHCFVARHLLGYELDTCETDSGLTLGIQYKLVMRTDLNQSPTGTQYYTRWSNKWQSLEQKQQAIARETFVRVDCRNIQQLYKQLQQSKAEMAILENLASDQVGKVFKFIADKVTLPVALWVRKDELSEELDRLLDCTVINLPERVFEERLDAMDGTCLGSHLSLVWEDRKIIPPTWDMSLIQ